MRAVNKRNKTEKQKPNSSFLTVPRSNCKAVALAAELRGGCSSHWFFYQGAVPTFRAPELENQIVLFAKPRTDVHRLQVLETRNPEENVRVVGF